ncbi:energy-coupling factor transport system substrate-specific component [Bifidobacterium commune]|uniref:Energy-coupling factor transport system substrate-specific component n=1 Tax=Bifidobacterium commune TaxID=1505727 RepID=A0A1C4H2Z8_9BIFI|nr:ECF transporter S component [Bifidobacterium commune]MBB2955063.1 energy-coupling factor transport system substrate-specific component [Bifidobacterium commune]SCC79369.1 energy-coupling factor transport system substrate-specific component [Bifidobacterium commune]
MAAHVSKPEQSSRLSSTSSVKSNESISRPSDAVAQIPANRGSRLRWRAADIAVGAALGVACGVVFWGFNFAYSWISPLLGAVLPGVASLLHAFWYFSGPLAVLIIRKPGAAVYVNFVGSVAEMVFGNSYSFGFVFLSALLQGVFAELPFTIERYRRFNLPLTVVSGVLTAVEYGIFVLVFRFQGVAFLSARGITHMVCEVIGGALIAGVMSWVLYLAIARTGALDRFASGRAVRRQ